MKTSEDTNAVHAFPVNVNAAEEKNFKDANEEVWRWYRRLGQISDKYLNLLINHASGIPKLNFKENEFKNCKVWLEAKSTRLGHTDKRKRAERKLDVISSDIMDACTPGLNEENFVTTFIDNFSGFVTTVCLKTKG